VTPLHSKWWESWPVPFPVRFNISLSLLSAAATAIEFSLSGSEQWRRGPRKPKIETTCVLSEFIVLSCVHIRCNLKRKSALRHTIALVSTSMANKFVYLIRFFVIYEMRLPKYTHARYFSCKIPDQKLCPLWVFLNTWGLKKSRFEIETPAHIG